MENLEQIFQQEAIEQLDQFQDLLLDAEDTADISLFLPQLMRSAHTLKGSAATAGQHDVSETFHAIEDLLHEIQGDTIAPIPALFDCLTRAVENTLDYLQLDPEHRAGYFYKTIEELKSWIDQKEDPTVASQEETFEFELGEYDLLRINALKERNFWFIQLTIPIKEVISDQDPVINAFFETIRAIGEMVICAPPVWEEAQLIESDTLQAIVATQAENLEAATQIIQETLPQATVEPYEINKPKPQDQPLPKLRADKTVRVNMQGLNDILRLAGELVSVEGRFHEHARTISSALADNEISASIEESAQQLGQLASTLQLSILRARMIPSGRLYRKIKRLVRKANRSKTLTWSVVTDGGKLEVDKAIVDSLKEPFFEYIDAIINTDLPVDSENDYSVALSTQAAGGRMIFEVATSNFPSEEIIKKVAALIHQKGGQMDCKQADGVAQTRFIMPTTLAIVPVMLFEVAKETFGIPLESIDETISVSGGQQETVGGKTILDYQNKPLPLCDMAELLQLPKNLAASNQFGIIIHSREKQIGLIVDTLIGKRDIVFKALSRRLLSIPILAGATILGNGDPALLLAPDALIKQAQTAFHQNATGRNAHEQQ